MVALYVRRCSVVTPLSVDGQTRALFHRQDAKDAKFSQDSSRSLRLCGEIVNDSYHQHSRGRLAPSPTRQKPQRLVPEPSTLAPTRPRWPKRHSNHFCRTSKRSVGQRNAPWTSIVYFPAPDNRLPPSLCCIPETQTFKGDTTMHSCQSHRSVLHSMGEGL